MYTYTQSESGVWDFKASRHSIFSIFFFGSVTRVETVFKRVLVDADPPEFEFTNDDGNVITPYGNDVFFRVSDNIAFTSFEGSEHYFRYKVAPVGTEDFGEYNYRSIASETDNRVTINGSGEYVFEARDIAGNIAVERRTIIVDSTPPVLSLEYFEGGIPEPVVVDVVTSPSQTPEPPPEPEEPVGLQIANGSTILW
jgi:hypothetical protein